MISTEKQEFRIFLRKLPEAGQHGRNESARSGNDNSITFCGNAQGRLAAMVRATEMRKFVDLNSIRMVAGKRLAVRYRSYPATQILPRKLHLPAQSPHRGADMNVLPIS